MSVVIGALLTSISTPGPYSWASTLIGVALLVLLYAFLPEWPQRPREQLGVAVAAAFALVLVTGILVDAVIHPHGTRLLSGWPVRPTSQTTLKQTPATGGWTFLFWIMWVGAVWSLLARKAVVVARKRRRELPEL